MPIWAWLFVLVAVAGSPANLDLVDGCCCTVYTVEEQNTLHINTLLNALTVLKAKCKEKEFFRYYKLHLDAPCSFWSTQQICGSHVEGGCDICECDENQVFSLLNKVPLSLRRLPEVLPTAATEANWLQQARWEWPWTVGAEGGKYNRLTAAVWVDLHLTVEGNTGYDGKKVWEAIYQENCLPAVEGGSCMEDYLLYRLVKLVNVTGQRPPHKHHNPHRNTVGKGPAQQGYPCQGGLEPCLSRKPTLYLYFPAQGVAQSWTTAPRPGLADW